ncbi:MAG: histidine kinase [Bacteroidia bacterium]|nr:histidine kinase [Bacteroidia bacterium]
MLKQKRILLHVGFWLIYFSVIIFNELYLSSSFLADPSSTWITKAILSQLLLLVVKIAAVYYVIYSLIPRWIKVGKKINLAIEGTLVFCFFVLTYRAMMHFIIWPYIYEEPGKIHALSMVARYLYSLLDILQVVGIAAAVKLFRLRIAAIKNEKLLQQEKFTSELLHLKAQINPHFLFNSLNSIFSLSRLQSDKTPDMVLKLSNILRYMLYESEKKMASIEDELKIINDYIDLQLMRYGDKVKVIKEITMKDASVQITPLIILPLVENCFKHGISGSEEVSVINFKLSLDKDVLTVQTKNILSKESVVLEKKEGIGLVNIKRQLELLYRDYSLNYFEKENYFIVDLKIKLASYAGSELFDSRG